ncbi:MAG TPA: hypothetical protein PK747_05045 [Acidobacteriota bacterium]|nr:hypothetical protein [Acidobacteriota bacterium]HNT17930.1 hypothetical protein [Acidobacteriota bacterium]HPA27478.1 hypothetical protein [Acidobacteriota bacterium]HQO18896.1 hypothetical protein [Acidobacteriota bacterium]HQQ46759.1 hypothetical protein [Acidobacteriota bacterium]
MARNKTNGERTVRSWPRVRGDPGGIEKFNAKLVLCDLFEMKEVKR